MTRRPDQRGGTGWGGSSLTLHQATYKILKWRRGRQWSQNGGGKNKEISTARRRKRGGRQHEGRRRNGRGRRRRRLPLEAAAGGVRTCCVNSFVLPTVMSHFARFLRAHLRSLTLPLLLLAQRRVSIPSVIPTQIPRRYSHSLLSSPLLSRFFRLLGKNSTCASESIFSAFKLAI